MAFIVASSVERIEPMIFSGPRNRQCSALTVVNVYLLGRSGEGRDLENQYLGGMETGCSG